MTNTNTNTDNRKFWLSATMCVLGVALLFTGMIVDPVGVITSSVIAGAGEIFITAGAILGIDVVYSHKLTQIIKEITEDKQRNNDNNRDA